MVCGRQPIHTGPTPGPWACNLLLVRVSDFAHTLFEDIQRRSRKANDFGPVKMSRIPESQFKIVQALVVNVGTLEKPVLTSGALMPAEERLRVNMDPDALPNPQRDPADFPQSKDVQLPRTA
jgi:hypothetical protein